MITTCIPLLTCEGNHSEALIGMRTQPWDAGSGGTDVDPWMA